MTEDVSSAAPQTVEFNFDGLVGPTHNYAGLAPGNLASLENANRISNPRAAALQGLAKMRRLRQLGIPQAVLPPLPRPDLTLLRRVGFRGDNASMLLQAGAEAPHLLAAAMSGSNMWTANAATVSPSADTPDGRTQFTPANLAASLHRSIESHETANVLRRIFHDESLFTHHRPLPACADLGDEGAANHSRFCDQFGSTGVEFFVYGEPSAKTAGVRPKKFRPRQTREACESIARLHQLPAERVVFAQQHPDAIDAGVFHNDVIAVGHRDLLFCHEIAFVDQETVYETLRRATTGRIRIATVSKAQVSLADAVSTYLFNSQIVTGPGDKTILVAPIQCEQNPRVHGLLDELVGDRLFDSIEFIDVGQSMNNGGGPACLRLRVVLTPDQQASIAQGVILTDTLESDLETWIECHYRDRLSHEDLADPELMRSSYEAIDELTRILDIGSLFDFQR